MPYIGGESLGCVQETASITEGKLLLLQVNIFSAESNSYFNDFAGALLSEQ